MNFDHYTLRLLEKTDAPAFFSLVEKNRGRLEDYFAGTCSKTKTLTDTEKYMDDVEKRIAEKTYFPYAIIDTTNSSIIGFIDVKRIDWHLPKGELGCFFDAEAVGKGLSKKALSTLVNYYFGELGFNKLFLRTHETNMAARALAVSCGFEIEGRLRKDHRTTKGEVVDLLYYGLIKQ